MTLTTSSVGSTASSSAGATTSIAGLNADSESRFLKLLTTQLSNQDPLNPLDNAQLTSQLAQMSTVSGIEKLNTTMASLLAQSGSSQVLQAANLIDKSVLAPGTTLTRSDAAATPFAIELPGAATAVKVSLTNAAGQVVRTFDLGGLPAGVTALSWDGTGDDGAALPDGSYRLSVQASGAGASVDAVALTYGPVASVAQGSRGVTLNLADGRQLGFSDVRAILGANAASAL